MTSPPAYARIVPLTRHDRAPVAASSWPKKVQALSIAPENAYSSAWRPLMSAQAAFRGQKGETQARDRSLDVGESVPGDLASHADVVSENAELAKLAQANPQAGLAELHKRFAPTVNRLIWRLLGPDSDHDDLVQQVFFAMLTSIGQLRDPAKLDVWVRTVTVNAVRQELRRRSVRRLFFSDQKHIRQVGDLVSEVESRDLLEQCVAVLDKIPNAQRLVFILHFVEGYSLKEVAELCSYSHITAKRRLKAANKRFRALVQHRPELLKRLSKEQPEFGEDEQPEPEGDNADGDASSGEDELSSITHEEAAL